MKRLNRGEARHVLNRFADQQGFTLVELLVTMVVGIIVLGAGTYGIAIAFTQNNEVSARTQAVSQAEAGLQRLTDDLRNAVNGSCGSSISGISVIQPSTNVYQLAMCEPTGSPNSNGNTSSLSTMTVTWTCNSTTASIAASAPYPAAAPWTCVRSAGGSTGPSFNGVESLSLTGLLTTVGSTPQALPYQTTAGSVTSTFNTYTLNAANSGAGASTVYSLSWIGISAKLGALAQAGGVTTVQSTTAIPVQTGAQLRNFGTT